MKKIIIVGSGGHGAELDDYIKYNNYHTKPKVEIKGYLDDNPDNYRNYKFSAPLIGGVKDHVVNNEYDYVIGIANLQYRKMFVEKYLEMGANFISIIHNTAYISQSAKTGKGVIIGPHVNLGPNAEVGDFSIVNSRCSLGHDTKIGKYNFISPNVCFSGFTKVGDENLFGINSVTIPNIKVGNNNKIAAGMVLHNDVGDNEVVFYRYKERIVAVNVSKR